MKITVDTMFSHVDFGNDTLLREKVHKIVHHALGIKVDGVQYNSAYRNGYWDGITDFYDMKEDKFHTGLLDQFLGAMRKLKELDPSFTYEIEDVRPAPRVHPDAIDEQIVLGNGDQNPITLRDYQYDSVKSIFKEQVGIVNVATNGGKCLPYFANITTSKGLMTLREFFLHAGEDTDDEGEKVVPYTGDISLLNRYGKLEKPSHLTFNGTRKVREVRGHRGTKNVVTLNHPLLVVDTNGTFVWKQSQDIEVGDFLVGRVGDNVYGSNSLVQSEEEAYALGAIIAEGYLGRDNLIEFTTNKPEVAHRLRKYLLSLTDKPDYELYTEKGKTTSDQFRLHDKKAVVAWHEKFGIAYGVAKDKHVPQCILESPKHIQMAFLSGYLESECSINKQKGCIDVSSASYTLINQVSLMLRNMGFVPTVRKKVVKGYEQNDYYVLALGSTDSIGLLKELTFISAKRKKQLEDYYEEVSRRKRNNKKEAVPFGKALAEAYRESYRKEDIPKGFRKKFTIPKSISKSRLRSLIQEFPKGDQDMLDILKELTSDHYVYEEVVEVKDIGEVPTFDVHMPETHSFIAEGIVNHNTEIASGFMQQVLPYLQRGERIAFFTHSKEIFHQSADRIMKRLNLKPRDIGKIGDGKFDIKNKKIVFVMVPTLVSALKDPKQGIKFTHKERVIKMIAEDITPKFRNTKNTRQLLRNFIKNCKLTTKVWQDVEEHLTYIAYDNKFTDKKAQMQLNKYIVEFDKIMEKKNKNKYKKYKDTTDFLESVTVMIADECLVEGSLVLLPDGGWKAIEKIKEQDEIYGGSVSNLIKREVPTVEVKSRNTVLEGSLTHPTFVVREEDLEKYKTKVKTQGDFEQVPLMSVKSGDYIPVLYKLPHHTKYNWTPEQLSLVALVMADGHLDKDSYAPDERTKVSNRVKVNVSKDQEWYLEEFTLGVKSFNGDYEVKHSYDCRGNLTVRSTDKELKSTLENVFQIPRGKKSHLITINEQIQYAPLESIKSFIYTYFSCEGDISIEKGGLRRKSPSYRLFGNTCSKEFAIGLQNLLRKFGIVSTLQIIKRQNENHNTVYRVGIAGSMFNKYMDTIGIMPRKDIKERNKGETPLVRVGDYVLSKVHSVEFFEDKKYVYDFTTSSHTFVANGALTHNCHHSKADTWYTSLSKCTNAIYRVGLTGTVDKKDPMGWQRLQAIFSQVVVRVSNDFLIGKGISSKPKIRLFPVQEPRNIELLNTYLEAYKAGIVENEVRNKMIVDIVKWYKTQRPGGVLISVKEIDHGDRILDQLKEQGYDAEFIHGGSDNDHRTDNLEKFSKGQLDILVSSTIIDEGVDMKSIGCMILAAGGKSMRQQLQRIGRGLRLNGIDGNSVMVFDFYDQTNLFLLNHSKERIKIFESENFDVKILGK
ncbi:putative intein containing DNA helicase [Bacillus phage BSP18]|nr:putative intein containing DNA helicase [Bacillus phage BSP18]